MKAEIDCSDMYTILINGEQSYLFKCLMNLSAVSRQSFTPLVHDNNTLVKHYSHFTLNLMTLKCSLVWSDVSDSYSTNLHRIFMWLCLLRNKKSRIDGSKTFFFFLNF